MSKLGIGPIDHILCPNNYRPHCEQAFKHALAISLGCGAALTLLHVGPEHRNDVSWARFPNVRDILVDWGRLDSDSDRSAIADELALDIHKTALRDQDSTQGILAYLDKHHTDLLVLGAGLPQGILAHFRRSRLRDLIRYSQETACLLIPTQGKALISNDDPHYQVRHAMLAWDKGIDPRSAIQFAASLLPVLATSPLQISLLHPPGQAPDIKTELPGIQGIEWRLQAQRDTADAERQLFEQGASLKADPDLLIFARQRRFGLAGWRQAHRLETRIRAARQPLLLVPEIY